jgi:predicted amidohydrolase YtcJ
MTGAGHSVADLLLVGRHIWTGTGRRTTAVAVRGGVVVALDDDAVRLRGPGTEVVELGERTLLPGFRDGHIHPLAGGTESLDCDLVDAADVDEVLARLGTYAHANPDVPWIRGYGYPPEVLPGGVGRASVLDQVVGDRPVTLWSSDHHMVWCNTAALQRAGITAATGDPPRGTIVRDQDGTPVGTLLEEAELLLEAHVPPWGTEREADGFREGLARMAAAGLVAGQDAWTQPERLASYLAVADAGHLTADIDLAFKVEVDTWREDLPRFLDARREAERAAARRQADGVPGGRLTATTAKFFIDGVIEGGTGFLLDPYEPGWGAGHACGPDGGDHGIANWEHDDLVEAATALDAAGFQLHCHAIGDAAVRRTLDVVADVTVRNGTRDRRAVVAHTHLVHPDDVGRFAALGVVANFEPLWAQRNAIMVDLTEPRLGAERSRWQYPIGAVAATGARLSFGSDWPVSSHVPLEGIAVAVTRQTTDGAPPDGWLPEQRIDLDTALRAYTSGSAYQLGQERHAGSIEVGADADLVVADAPIEEVTPRELADDAVADTWLRGVRVHGAGV